MHKKFEINWTKIKGGCQSGRKVVTHNSNSDLPLDYFINEQGKFIHTLLFETLALIPIHFWSIGTILMICYVIFDHLKTQVFNAISADGISGWDPDIRWSLIDFTDIYALPGSDSWGFICIFSHCIDNYWGFAWLRGNKLLYSLLKFYTFYLLYFLRNLCPSSFGNRLYRGPWIMVIVTGCETFLNALSSAFSLILKSD